MSILTQLVSVVGILVVFVYVLWTLYLAVMSLASARNSGRLPVWAKRLGYPILVAGYLLDFLANMVVLSIVMMEIPKELLVTSRLSRHIKAGDGYRNKVAKWICHNMLDFADPKGCHCR